MTRYVWCMLTAKKREKIGFDSLVRVLVDSTDADGTQVVLIDPTNEESLGFLVKTVLNCGSGDNVILHKLSDFTKEDASTDRRLGDLIEGVREALRPVIPRIRIINSFDGLALIADRWRTIEYLRGLEGLEVQVPRTRFGGAEELAFPALWKSISACGQAGSHDMLFLRDSGCRPAECAGNGIVQEFIRHHRMLFKVFVIGAQIHIDIRPSLGPEDFTGTASVFPFDSEYARSRYSLTEDQKEFGRDLIRPHSSVIETTSRMIQSGLSLDLFGWDLIIGEADCRPYIIDINNFPKFDGVPHFHEALCDLIVSNR